METLQKKYKSEVATQTFKLKKNCFLAWERGQPDKRDYFCSLEFPIQNKKKFYLQKQCFTFHFLLNLFFLEKKYWSNQLHLKFCQFFQSSSLSFFVDACGWRRSRINKKRKCSLDKNRQNHSVFFFYARIFPCFWLKSSFVFFEFSFTAKNAWEVYRSNVCFVFDSFCLCTNIF